MSKYYFYDLGIRNTLISNFNDLDTRNDQGQLWENFLILERIKQNAYTNTTVNYYFWRTYDQKEIDLIEEYGGKLYGYEFKWKSAMIKKSTRQEFLKAYPNSELSTISQENFEDFLLSRE